MSAIDFRLSRRRSARLAWLLAVCAVGPLAAGAVYGQTARSGGAPNALLMQQMQQLASERTSLQVENQKLKKQLDDMKRDRDQLKKGHDATDQRLRAGETALARSNQQRESSEQEVTQAKAKLQELIGKFREMAQSLRDVETENATNRQSLVVRNHELQTCVERNLALYKLNDEVLTHIDRQGVWSRVAQAEPFTRIKRVQNDNLVVEYKAKAQDQRVTPPSAAAPPAAAAKP